VGSDFDAVIVGSGVNGLACAALLAKAGRRVCVLERNDWLGGAIRTAEITEPGFRHDVFSAWHPLWVGGAAHAQLGDDLAAHGLEYLNTEHPTATLFPDGEAAFLLRSADANAAELDRHHDGDGDAWRALLGEFFPTAELAFGILGTELWSRHGVGLALKAYRQLGRRGAADFAGRLVVSARDRLTSTFASERAHGLLAPWVLHTGLGPDAAASGYMSDVIAVAVQEGGMPIPRGGGAKLADALVAFIRARGGTCSTGVDVERVLVSGGRAVGVATSGGEQIGARHVICNVTPTQLYGKLLPDVPANLARQAREYRYGRADMQIHFALSEPPKWEGDERLGQTAIVHLTPGLDGVSRAVNEADRGLLPAEATVVVGQPLTMDPSRAPDGRGILWVQLQELPWHVKGDAAGEIDVGDGTWSPELRERYADRIQARIARHIPNLQSSILGRTCLSPADLQAANVNLVHGDPYSGSLALDQNFLWRPLRSAPGHRTFVKGVWHVGASTHPGPGLGAGSGALVAAALLRRR
jgi:phytoene dehydrogenase-like protein